MNTLHVCNGYAGSEVHKNLCGALAKLGCRARVFVAIRDPVHRKGNMPPPMGVEVQHIDYNNKLLKYFPLLKMGYLYLRLRPLVVNLIHREESSEAVLIAHTLWSDGVLAYWLSRKTGSRFLLIVRNTDMNVFLPGLPHYRWLIKAMIRKSEALVFVSQAHRTRFAKNWPRLYAAAGEVRTIPNGVGDYWIENSITSQPARPKRICFVGSFLPAKNLKRLMAAVYLARETISELEAWFVGGGLDDFIRATRLSGVPEFVRVISHTESRDELREIYRSSRVMAMPSLRETFGLVYVEALSQGCAVICSQGEGFDGAISDDAVRAVDPHSIMEIADAIVELVTAYPSGLPPERVDKTVGRFNWSTVAREYADLLGLPK